MRRISILFLITIMLCTAAFAADSAAPEFKVIYQSVYNGQENATLLDFLVFEFNLRIDHVGIKVMLNGNGDMIEKVLVKEGKRLEIYLKEPLGYESEYTITLEGIKEIYSSQPSTLSTVTFKTLGRVEIMEQNIDNVGASFYALVKNYSSSAKDIKFIVAVKEKQTRKIMDIKIITKNIESGEEVEFSHDFGTMQGNYEICAYGFYELHALIALQ